MAFGAKIQSWGRAVPKKVVTNDDLTKLFDTSDEWITQRTGIKERRVVEEGSGETAVSLATQAAKNALAKSKQYSGKELAAEDIDLIICATATGDFLFPSTACMVQAELGATNAVAFDISAACTGFIFALNTAYNYIHSGQFKNVLVIGVDLMSRFTDWSDRRTAIIFGDGAGACLVSAVPESENAFHPFYIRSRGDTACSLYLKNQGTYYPKPASEMAMTKELCYMDGKAVYEFAVKAVPEAMDKACELSGISPEEIDYLVPHQANIRIIKSAAKRFKFPAEKVLANIDRYGNTSAASIPIAMDEALEEGKVIKSPDTRLKLALVGFGAGLTWGSVIVEF